MRISLVLGAVAALSAISGLAHGQANSQPGVVTSGAAGVIVNGKPAARSGDTTSNGGPLVEGVPNVLINGKPAVVMGDRTHCGGKTTSGSHGVFINGKPMVPRRRPDLGLPAIAVAMGATRPSSRPQLRAGATSPTRTTSAPAAGFRW